MQEMTDPAVEDRRLNVALALSSFGLGAALLGGVVGLPVGLLAFPLLTYALLPYFHQAYRSVFIERRMSMPVLDVLLILLFAVSGQWIALGFLGMMLAVCRKLLLKAQDRSEQRIINLFGGDCRTAWILIDGEEIEVPLHRLSVGDVVILRTGETAVADGTVVRGSGTVDQSLLTGEACPVEKVVGDPVSAATTVLSGHLCIRVDRSGEDTIAGQITRILNRTIDYRRNLEWRWAKTVDKTVVPSLASGALVLPFLGPIAAAKMIFIASGPAYSMLAIAPLQLLSYLHRANGAAVLIKDGRVLERLMTIDTVVFDKTGTLTLDQLRVRQIHRLAEIEADEILAYVSTAEQRNTHPIAMAVLAAAAERGIRVPPADDSTYELGLGLRTVTSGRTVHVGSIRFLSMEKIAIPGESATIEATAHDIGNSMIWVAVDHKVVGALELEPMIRPEVPKIIKTLKERGLSVFILSGDHERPTRHLATRLNVDGHFAEVLPSGKADAIADLQKAGRRVTFVGDGVNDALALRQADVSISIRGAATAAADTAQIILIDGTLARLTDTFSISNSFRNSMALSFRINLIPLVLGAGGILFANIGMIPILLLYYACLGVGAADAVRPLVVQPTSVKPSIKDARLTERNVYTKSG